MCFGGLWRQALHTLEGSASQFLEDRPGFEFRLGISRVSVEHFTKLLQAVRSLAGVDQGVHAVHLFLHRRGRPVCLG